MVHSVTDRNLDPRRPGALNQYLPVAYSDGNAPGANSNVYVLFDSTTDSSLNSKYADGSAIYSDYRRYILSLKNSQAGVFKAYTSPDRGQTWVQYYEVAVAAASATNFNNVVVPIEPHPAVRYTWTNGGVAQSTWLVFQALDGEESTLTNPSAGSGSNVTVTNFPAVQPVSGTVTATNPSVGTVGSAVPTSATEIGGSDGTNLQTVRIKPASTAAAAADPSLVVAISPNSPAKISDGTNTAAVKAASTAALATDPALVVSVSPNSAISQGVPAAVGNAWNVKVTDGTRTANVKAASTAAVAADPALVVALSPASTMHGQTTPTATVTNCMNSIQLAVYNTSAPTLTNGQFASCQMDVNANLKTREAYAPVAEDNTNGVIATAVLPTAVSTYAQSCSFTTALSTNLVIKSGAGKIRSISGRIDATATTGTYYLMLLNATSAVNGTVVPLMAPVRIQHVNGTSDPFTLDFTESGIFASTGITLALSTTDNATLTLGGSFLQATALYK